MHACVATDLVIILCPASSSMQDATVLYTLMMMLLMLVSMDNARVGSESQQEGPIC